MTAPEVELSVEWVAVEGWTPGKYDAECFRKADPEGFLIGGRAVGLVPTDGSALSDAAIQMAARPRRS